MPVPWFPETVEASRVREPPEASMPVPWFPETVEASRVREQLSAWRPVAALLLMVERNRVTEEVPPQRRPSASSLPVAPARVTSSRPTTLPPRTSNTASSSFGGLTTPGPTNLTVNPSMTTASAKSADPRSLTTWRANTTLARAPSGPPRVAQGSATSPQPGPSAPDSASA